MYTVSSLRKNIRFLGDEYSDQDFTDAMVVTQPTCLSGFSLKLLGFWTSKTCNETLYAQGSQRRIKLWVEMPAV